MRSGQGRERKGVDNKIFFFLSGNCLFPNNSLELLAVVF